MTRQAIRKSTITGDVLSPVTLTASELGGLRHAHELFGELRGLLCEAIVPALGGASHPINARLYDLLSEVVFHSGNFGYRHWRDAEQKAGEQWRKGREVSYVSR
ncbi:hypothetical protein ACI2KS_23815 [Pseudomonas sp. NPDC087358]|uniref:hypothetical protein n=1 Tax=Pseudomonas sp. NPDC087358 TaxID=3364439 RepID=UPI00384DCBDA